MIRHHALKAKSDPRPQLLPTGMRVDFGSRQRMSPKRIVTHVLVWVPILACLSASLKMGQTENRGDEQPSEEEEMPTEKEVLVLMRSAPMAAETEGGMPVDLLRIIEEPVVARAQSERAELLYRRWAGRNPRDAGQSALVNWRLFDSVKPLEAVLEQWLDKDPDAAMNWVMEEIGSPGKGERLEMAFGEVLAVKPVETRSRWATRFPDEPALAANVAAEWARQDPAAAVEWLSSMRAGEGKREGLRALVATWMDWDPARAGAFVVAMAPGRLREMALATVAEVSPGGLALEPATAVEETGPRIPGDPVEGDWLVRREGREESPRTIRRKPGADGAKD